MMTPVPTPASGLSPFRRPKPMVYLCLNILLLLLKGGSNKGGRDGGMGVAGWVSVIWGT